MKMMSRRGFHKSLRIEGLTHGNGGRCQRSNRGGAVAEAGYDPASEVIYARISKKGLQAIRPRHSN